jgi:hypothetical protein
LTYRNNKLAVFFGVWAVFGYVAFLATVVTGFVPCWFLTVSRDVSNPETIDIINYAGEVTEG